MGSSAFLHSSSFLSFFYSSSGILSTLSYYHVKNNLGRRTHKFVCSIKSYLLNCNLQIVATLNDQVVSEYRDRGMDLVLQAINHPTYLEDLTGLTELMRSASSFKLDWDNEVDDDDDGDILEI